MSTALDTDIKALVGEMPAVPCDTLGHTMGLDVHDDGPATHYWRWHKPCGCVADTVVSRCHTFTLTILANEGMECGICHAEGHTAKDFYTLIGPIGGFS